MGGTLYRAIVVRMGVLRVDDSTIIYKGTRRKHYEYIYYHLLLFLFNYYFLPLSISLPGFGIMMMVEIVIMTMFHDYFNDLFRPLQ